MTLDLKESISTHRYSHRRTQSAPICQHNSGSRFDYSTTERYSLKRSEESEFSTDSDDDPSNNTPRTTDELFHRYIEYYLAGYEGAWKKIKDFVQLNNKALSLISEEERGNAIRLAKHLEITELYNLLTKP